LTIRHYTSRNLREVTRTARGNQRSKAARIKARLNRQNASMNGGRADERQ